MNLPTLDSSEPSGPEGAARLLEPEYLAQARERGGRGSISTFPGWPSSLYSNLNQKSSMPPKEPEESIPVQLPTTTGMAIATSLKWVSWTKTEILQMAKPNSVDYLGKLHCWLPGASSELQARADATTIIKCPKGGYEHLIIESKGWSSREQEPSGYFRMLLNTCLLKWADDVRQLDVDPSHALGAAWKSHFTVHHHGPFPPQSQKKFLIDWAKEIPAQIEVQLLIHGLKLYLDSDVEKARMIARRGVSKFPESRDLQKILKLLSPSKVVAHPASGVSRKHDFEWIRANQNRYRGQWVAIFEGQCLASGKDLRTVRESARKLKNLERVLITYLPAERG